MSFALTKEQIKNQTKDVTRRNGWKFLKQGDFVQPVEKTMGLKKGENIKRIGGPIRIVDVKREPLSHIHFEQDGCKREGFPNIKPEDFVNMYCQYNGIMPCEPITRIEFKYVEEKV